MQSLLSNLYHEFKKQYKLKLLAGEKGLSAPISWVHYVEDIGNISFIRSNELIITTGMDQKNDTSNLTNLVKSLIASPSSALIINTGKYIQANQIPQEVYNLCNQHNFPLFSMPWEVHIADISQDMCNRIFMKNYLENAITRLFSNLMEGRPLSLEQYAKLEAHSFPDSGFWHVLLISHAISTINIRNHLDSLQISHHLFLQEDSHVLIVHDCLEETIIDFLKNFLSSSKLQKAPGSVPSPTHPIIGIGEQVTSLKNLKYSYQNAVRALEHARLVGKDYFFFRDFGVRRLVYSIANPVILQHIYRESIGILKLFDMENGTQLFDTLKVYYRCNESILDTASTMFTHRNTINYRLKKIRSLLPQNMDDSEDALLLKMAFYLEDIARSSSLRSHTASRCPDNEN